MANSTAVPPSNKRWATVSAREQIRRRYFPDVTLTTHDGRKVRFYDELTKDRCVMLNFMYSFTLKPEEDSPADLLHYMKVRRIGPGWTFLTGAPHDLELVRQRLGFTDPDPARDADKTNHTGMVRYGNEGRQLWAAFPGMSSAEAIAKQMTWVAWPDGVDKVGTGKLTSR